ncbi:MAG: hypothetical protein EPN86_01190 [Nanoarchaeota archaeon]|nr:MAG: hypothetical protein EPN86_01190 [Nanoarchaeota archaeon]
MVHIKRLSAPRSWPISRKSNTFVVRPFPGSHGFAYGTSLATVLTEIIKLVDNSSDLRKILNNKSVMVDGIARTHPRFFVGMFDTIELPAVKKAYRISLNSRGMITAVSINHEESKLKVCKVIGKTNQKGGAVQLNFHDGTNLVIKDSAHKVGDSILFQLPARVPQEHLKLEKDSVVYLTGGTHQGSTGKVVEVVGSTIKLSIKNDTIETPKKYAIVVGKGKPAVTVI